MLAKELKKLVNTNGCVTVRIVAPSTPEEQDNMSDWGASVASISTYLQSGMIADIIDACTMPPMPLNMPDAEPYLGAVVPGMVYFVFQHDLYKKHNETLASTDWQNSEATGDELLEGTAVQVGAYSGYDMIGFPPDTDMSTMVELVESV